MLVVLTALGCGTDAERRYAGLSTRRVVVDEGGYMLRYLSPPWQRAKGDPLDTGARKRVPIGGMNVPIIAGTGTVLEIDVESNVDDAEGLSFPKYRLETALVPCAAEETEGLSCAEYLAGLDYAARQSEGAFDLFGPEPRLGKNDSGHEYYELMGQTEATLRYRRAIFFSGEAPERLAGWMLIEANPDLGEREITELVQAFSLLPGTPEAEP